MSTSPVQQDALLHARVEVAECLGQSPPHLPYRLLWDEHNTALYDRIREQPEYYLNRLEMHLLQAHASEVMAASGARTLIELGSGTGEKALPLLQHMTAPVAYLPVDVSTSALNHLTERLRHASPSTTVRAVAADFTRPWPPVLREPGRRPVLVTFLGSTLGNLLPAERHGLLELLAGSLRPGDGLLLGVPLLHDVEVMVSAYRDAAGLMEAFYLHCLRILNRDLGTDFDLDAYAHHVVWAAPSQRVEIGLCSLADQTVLVPGPPAGRRVVFPRGEVLRATIAVRFTAGQLDDELAARGFEPLRHLPDPTSRYMLLLARLRG
ncbi:L-histidine N(alpha)-methyltransferase [Streptomyces sp. WAC05374]|uniref:L-histidine N(alpha)-methyltransferase n=1 Tax=Streptomyces sp. WAC05374 TaxID=2487420 RepID=UPI000F89ABB0|nr:L-histidine N(alpha)-methyltransferase [Streptomyces sp. WAC05374]RST19603.1 L-histidine N(alpha)-methyltransferase [Streptomyces sp. WAC05374]TDF50060.1 L-histidine N(alpha)-methyltransferase [Streptomyces sp. WAC05374]TDF57786.1 L-histidine N(alpha)-methyltransferase [Streptomyces sp. WAC05374]TDF60314.1 L-histidine N(alpha)-methyltransferase [Streptomyces sp. WAC05374]